MTKVAMTDTVMQACQLRYNHQDLLLEQCIWRPDACHSAPGTTIHLLSAQEEAYLCCMKALQDLLGL